VHDLIERERRIERPSRGTSRATRLAQLTVQLEQIARPRPAMERIDVLRRKREIGNAPLEFGERHMGRSGRTLHVHGSPLVPRPNKSRIASEALWRGKFFDFVRPPKAAHAAERRQPALAADSAAGEHHDR